MKVNDKSGQALIEALVAIGFMIVGFLAIFSLLSRSLSLNRSSAESYTAAYLAAEGIEVARNIVDANGIQKKAWSDGFSSGDYEIQYDSTSFTSNQNRFIFYNPSTNLYSYGGQIQTPFKRLIRIRMISAAEIRVNSIVSWTSLGGGSPQINVEDHFMNWRI